MDKLYGWRVQRAGSGMTVTHSCGKITGVRDIVPESGKVVAIGRDERRFELVAS